MSKDLEKKSPPGRKKEVEELKAKGVPASEAFAIAWKQQNEHGAPKHEKNEMQVAAPKKAKLPRTKRDINDQAKKKDAVRTSVGNLMDNMLGKADMKVGARTAGPQMALPGELAHDSTAGSSAATPPSPPTSLGGAGSHRSSLGPKDRMMMSEPQPQPKAKAKLPRKSAKKNEIEGYGGVGGELAMSEKPLNKGLFDQAHADKQRQTAIAGEKPKLPRKSGISHDPTWSPAQPAMGAAPSPFGSAPPPIPADAPPKAPAKVANLFAGKYPLADASHHDEVATNASINMLKLGMPREQAEAKAHGDYVNKLRTDAMHYHAAGMKAASSIGDNESAKSHAAMFQLHREALGDNPVGAPLGTMAGQPISPRMKFKPHPGDHFAVNK